MSKINSETYTGYRESPAQIEEPAVDASTEPQASEAQPQMLKQKQEQYNGIRQARLT